MLEGIRIEAIMRNTRRISKIAEIFLTQGIEQIAVRESLNSGYIDHRLGT